MVEGRTGGGGGGGGAPKRNVFLDPTIGKEIFFFTQPQLSFGKFRPTVILWTQGGKREMVDQPNSNYNHGNNIRKTIKPIVSHYLVKPFYYYFVQAPMLKRNSAPPSPPANCCPQR